MLLSNEGPSNHYGASVVVNPDDADASRHYKMAYWDFDQKGSSGDTGPNACTKGLCSAFSPDGIRWTKHSDNPVPENAVTPRTMPPLVSLPEAGKKKDGPLQLLAVSDVIDAI